MDPVLAYQRRCSFPRPLLLLEQKVPPPSCARAGRRVAAAARWCHRAAGWMAQAREADGAWRNWERQCRGGMRKGAPAPGGGRTGAAASGCVGEGKGGDGIGSGWDGGNLGFLGRVRECVIYTGGY